MRLRSAQVLAAIGVTLLVASTRWAWVLSVHRPHPQNTMKWTAPVLAGLLALAALGWSVWRFRTHPRVGATVDESSPRRWPLHRMDQAYSILCCAVGGGAALLFIMETTEPASWLLTGPPMLFAHLVAPFPAWQPGPDRELFTIFAFVLYYHLFAAPGYALLSRVDVERDEKRTRLLTGQWAFLAVHLALTALVAWLMQA